MMFRLCDSRIASRKVPEFSISPHARYLPYCRSPLTTVMSRRRSQDKPSRWHLTTDFTKALPVCCVWLSLCCFVSQNLPAPRAGTAWAAPPPRWQYFILAPTPCFGGLGRYFTAALTRAFLQPADAGWICSLLPEQSPPPILHGYSDLKTSSNSAFR